MKDAPCRAGDGCSKIHHYICVCLCVCLCVFVCVCVYSQWVCSGDLHQCVSGSMRINGAPGMVVRGWRLHTCVSSIDLSRSVWQLMSNLPRVTPQPEKCLMSVCMLRPAPQTHTNCQRTTIPVTHLRVQLIRLLAIYLILWINGTMFNNVFNRTVHSYSVFIISI